jgi:hypothetical protein
MDDCIRAGVEASAASAGGSEAGGGIANREWAFIFAMLEHLFLALVPGTTEAKHLLPYTRETAAHPSPRLPSERDGRKLRSYVMWQQPRPSPTESAEMTMVSVRGTALLPVRPFIDRYFGPSGAEQFHSFLNNEPDSARVALGPVLPSTWYPFRVALDVVDGLVAMAGHPRVLRDFAAYNLDYATGAIFKAIFKLGTPEFMALRADQVWRKFYSRGRMTCTATRGQASVQLHDFAWLRPNYDRLVQHSVEAVLVKAGARNCAIKHSWCLLRGDPFCQSDYEWKT